jgi:hypothetical protein
MVIYDNFLIVGGYGFISKTKFYRETVIFKFNMADFGEKG